MFKDITKNGKEMMMMKVDATEKTEIHEKNENEFIANFLGNILI